MARHIWIAATILVTACSETTDPFSSGDGAALVTGVVSDAAGTPLTGTSVRIDCPGASAIRVTTDSTGVYLISLRIDERTVRMTGGRVPCRWQEPSSGIPRASLSAIVGFAQGPVFLAKQRFDLHEP